MNNCYSFVLHFAIVIMIVILILIAVIYDYLNGFINGRIDREHDGIIHVKDLVLFFGETIPVRNFTTNSYPQLN